MAAHTPAASHGPSGTHDGEDHESVIKTPRQLITVVVLAFVVPIIVILLLVSFVSSAPRTGAGTAGMTPGSIEARIKPVAGFELRAGGASAVARTGEEVYKAVCAACHVSGAANAPKTGDQAAWAPRLKAGLEALVAAASKGKGAMPAQAAGDTTEFEVARAVVYLANQAGGSFEEPKAPVAAAK
jgi:cytochrome c5